MSRKLLVQDGPSQRELLLVGTMVVGRHPSCEISSPDPRLSRRHAEISVTPEGVTVRDLQSRNGIRVNGQSVSEACLQPGDVLHVAHLALQFVPDDAPPSRPPSVSGTSETLAIAAPAPALDDDRTRVVRPAAFGVSGGRGVAPVTVQREVLDERTRIAPAAAHRGPVLSSLASGPVSLPAPVDAGDVVIRPPARPAQTAPAPMSVVGVGALARLGWGRRVLAHGVLVALLVHGVTLVPLLAWQAQTFGTSILSAWHVLLPALGASVLAGVLVSTLIARLTARGLAGSDAARRAG